MTAPNVYLSSNTVTAETLPFALTTSEQTVLTNAASSNAMIEVAAITLNNIITSGTVDVTVRLYNAASGGTAFAMPAITIPIGGSVIVIGTENKIFLAENTRITIAASANSAATAYVSRKTVTT
jgi:hypothetical protein